MSSRPPIDGRRSLRTASVNSEVLRHTSSLDVRHSSSETRHSFNEPRNKSTEAGSGFTNTTDARNSSFGSGDMPRQSNSNDATTRQSHASDVKHLGTADTLTRNAEPQVVYADNESARIEDVSRRNETYTKTRQVHRKEHLTRNEDTRSVKYEENATGHERKLRDSEEQHNQERRRKSYERGGQRHEHRSSHVSNVREDEGNVDDHDDYCSSCEETTEQDESLVTTTNSSDMTSSSNSLQQECWDNDVQPNGELMYISCHYHVKSSCTYEEEQLLSKIQKQQLSSSTPKLFESKNENKIIKLIRKKSLPKKKHSKLNIEIPSTNKLTKKSNYIPCGEPKEFVLNLNQNLNLGRRALLSEIKLGLQFNEDHDALRIVDMIPDSSIYNSKLVNVNDILLSINDVHVTKHNINQVLATLPNPSDVKLKVQNTKNKHELSRQKNNYKSKLVNEILNGVESGSDKSDLCLIYINDNAIQYGYPSDKNNLRNSYGLFLTLNSLFNSTCVYSGTSSVECDSYVIFTRDRHCKHSSSNNLLLISYPIQHFPSYDYCLRVNKLIVNCIRFQYGYVFDNIFHASNATNLNKMFSFLFNRLLINVATVNLLDQISSNGAQTLSGNEKVSNEEYIKIFKTESLLQPSVSHETKLSSLKSEYDRSHELNDDTIEVEPSRTMPTSDEHYFIHDNDFLFVHPRKLKINSELEQQINDALGELEANDTYEDGIKNFIVIGTCLFYKQHLLSSHMYDKDLVHLHSLLYCSGLLYLNKHERNIKNIIVWRQIYTKQHVTNNLYYNNKLKANNKYYLLIYGKNNFLLCTILESNYFTNNHLACTSNIQPDIRLIKHSEEIIHFLTSTRNMNYLNKEIALLTVQGFDSKSYDSPRADKNDSLSLAGSYQSTSTITDEDYGDYQRKQSASETALLLPTKLLCSSTNKANILFHYCNVNNTDGIVFSPNAMPHMDEVFNKYRQCVYKIQKCFKNYVKFKKLNNSLNNKHVQLNKSILCIKEYGQCFELNENRYWTIGRLYSNSNEIYVCYLDDRTTQVLSQNMIEIVFKLFLSYS